MLELITGLQYWNYVGHFLNINGRICLEGLMEFGLGGLLCVYFIAPKLNSLFNKCSKKFLISIFSSCIHDDVGSCKGADV